MVSENGSVHQEFFNPSDEGVVGDAAIDDTLSDAPSETIDSPTSATLPDTTPSFDSSDASSVSSESSSVTPAAPTDLVADKPSVSDTASIAAAKTPTTATSTPASTTKKTESKKIVSAEVAPQAISSPTVTPQASYRNQWVTTGGNTYYYNDQGQIQKGWCVNTTYKTYGLQRYWLDAKTGALFFSKLINYSGSNYTYATKYGYVVRGRYVENGKVYLANEDGKLENPGWVVSGTYTSGTLQRYYIDASTHSAKTGFFTVGSSRYYGIPSTGYELRSALKVGAALINADNDGVLSQRGWLVTEGFGQGLQRYWFSNYEAVKSRFVTASEAGYWAYATSSGYVLRGALKLNSTQTLLADNDGRLNTSKTGWAVTALYDGANLQRYYLVSTGKGYSTAKTGYFKVGGSWYYGIPGNGYELRGSMNAGNNCVILADNDGVLNSNATGWVVTSCYDGNNLQRYWMVSTGKGYSYAKSGYFEVQSVLYYAYPSNGKVARNIQLTRNGVVYRADNDGKLFKINSIMGTSLGSTAQMISYYKSTGHAYPTVALKKGGASSVETFFTILTQEAVAEGVRADLLFAQVVLETGWLSFPSDVRASQYNFGGMGVTGGSQGLSFPDVRTGLRAQVQHLKAFATTAPLNNPCVDPYYSSINHGFAPNIEDLTGTWAASSSYSDLLLSIMKSLLSY